MISPTTLTSFETALRSGKITETELRIYKADKEPGIHTQPNATEELREVLRRFFTLYGINPGVQFSDTAFKEAFLRDVTQILLTYYPSISRASLELAIELNLINYFQLTDRPQVYGDRITASFLLEVLNIYRTKRGPIIQKLEKLIPTPEPEVDQEKVDAELLEMLREDIANSKEGPIALRLPDLYYNLLFRKGLMSEEDKYINELKERATRILQSQHEFAKRKEAAPLDLKALDLTRQFLKGNRISYLERRTSIMKEEAVLDYIRTTKQLKE